MVVATGLDPPRELFQSLQMDTSECQELMLHIGHVLKWSLLFYSFPLILALPQMVEELRLQPLSLCLCAGGVVVQIEGPENVAQVLLPPLAPIVGDALQRVSGGPLRTGLIGLPDGGPLPSSSGVTGRLMALISALGSQSPTYISVPTV